MVDMPNDGDSAILSPSDNNDESKSQKFTAVNNNNNNSNNNNNNSGNGNGSTVVMSHRAQLPPIIPAQAPRNGESNASASTLDSPRHGEDQWQQGNRPGSDVEMAGTSQKRKRSPEVLNQQRAVTPTTQITHHHLAAHEAAMAEEHSGIAHNINQHRHQSSLGPEDHTGNYSVDEDMKGNDDGRERAGTQEGSPQPGATQGDSKKRKRIFSNRTKTGCITCRRRKKKCDEGKPECSNCKRGGFVCEGYSGKINWQKPPGKSGNSGTTPVSIQSKTEQPESASVSPTPVHVVPASVPKQLHHRPEEPRRIPYQPAAVATIVIDEAKSGLEESGSPNSAIRQQLPHSYSNEQPTHTPKHQTYASVPQQAPPHLPAASTPVTNHNASSLAAISAASGSTLPRQRSEKEKMINSELYHARALELVEERERCRAACWRFNNAATNPNLGISKTEKGRLLLDVIRPGTTWEVITQPAGPGKPPQVAYVNEQGYPSDIVDVQVDAPFTCSYGYNIRLGKDVYIEFGCTILDSCAVTIKARTILSPNVSIYSATHPIDPRKRNGAQGPEVAKPVMIEEDCWLGGNVIVLGGITIGKGSVVGAGSVVTRDVPPFTVVAGNPARVIRGIYQNGVDM